MAKAIVRGGLNQVRTLTLAHTAAVEAYDVIVSNGQVLVACNDADANVSNSYVFGGPVEFPKEAALAIAVGDVCYWVAGNGNVNKTAGGNTKAGICTKAAAAADTVVLIELGENK
jgi:predicted RecA/RadA family phage recombinase